MGLFTNPRLFENQAPATTPAPTFESIEEEAPKSKHSHHVKHSHRASHQTHQEKPQRVVFNASRVKDGVKEPFSVNVEHVGKNKFTPESAKSFNKTMVSIMRLQKRGLDDMATARLQEKIETDAEFKQNWKLGMHSAESKKEMIRQIARASGNNHKYEPMSKAGVENRLERLRKSYIHELDKKIVAAKSPEPAAEKKPEAPMTAVSLFEDIDAPAIPTAPTAIQATKASRKVEKNAASIEPSHATASKDSLAAAVDSITADNKSGHISDLCSYRVQQEAADNPERGSQLAAMCNDVFGTKLPTKHAIVTNQKGISKRDSKEQAQFAAETKKVTADDSIGYRLTSAQGMPEKLTVRGMPTDSSPEGYYAAMKYNAHKDGLVKMPEKDFEKLKKTKPAYDTDVVIATNTGHIIEEKPLKPIFKAPKAKAQEAPQPMHYAKM